MRCNLNMRFVFLSDELTGKGRKKKGKKERSQQQKKKKRKEKRKNEMFTIKRYSE